MQRYIYFAYLNQPAVQLALMDVARSLQAALVSAESREDAYQAVKSFDAAYNCLSWIERDATYELVSRLLAQQMNTRDRTRAYDEFQKAAVGNVIMNNKSSENYYQECSFDISQY
ncbi:hypothetical protein JCM19232_4881 [Vibrio ishigakensis]|uniref:Uncharacterized protein n=1 Tax=Vibrio ishigakensis TaxID=1481914 RepID=A0A0B8PSB7_9VIBR|nr:hypothetical protein JCM19232_4881 [Vibrio ishigakensis]